MSTHITPHMSPNDILQSPNYNPDHLINTLLNKLRLKNDAALARELEVAPPVLSKIRHKKLPVGATILLRMHEISDISIKDLRALMGVEQVRQKW